MEKKQIYDVVDEHQANSTRRKKNEMTTTTTHLDSFLDMEMNVSYQPSTLAKDYEVPRISTENDDYLDIGMNANYVSSANTNHDHGLQSADYNDIKYALKATKKCVVVITFLLVIFLLITLTATALAVFSCIAIRSIQPADSSQNEVILNGSPEYAKLWNNFTTQLDQLAEATWTNISQVLTQFNEQLQTTFQVTNCGPGLWQRVAYLNMSEPSQQCPPEWREYGNNTSGVRACGRLDTSRGSCSGTFYSISRRYSRVCGRVIGYQFGTPDAFGHYANNSIIVDGISITYGAPSNHIWDYVAGVSENSNHSPDYKCPCNTSNAQHRESPSLKYYCESGNPNFNSENRLYLNDKLWDGKQCEGTCCTGNKSPPWFSVQLPAPTNDMIEVNICCDEDTSNEDIPVELMEILVQ